MRVVPGLICPVSPTSNMLFSQVPYHGVFRRTRMGQAATSLMAMKMSSAATEKKVELSESAPRIAQDHFTFGESHERHSASPLGADRRRWIPV